MSYPIFEVLPQLRQTLSVSKTVLLQAPPGAGKSTVLPLELMNESWLENQKIIMLEPRRLAAKSVAQRMANLQNESLGEGVGYRVRFDSNVGKNTRIEVVTEGILTRMLQHDNALEGVGMVIFDEFHERSLQADLALALCLQVQQVLRDDLRILIMSATLDGEQILSALGKVPVLSSLGKQFPVEIKYTKDKDDIHVTTRVVTAIRRSIRDDEGDILVFLPGAWEINKVQSILEEENPGVSIQPLYGDLPFNKQQQAILPDPGGKRKVVLATSIAETSLTIEGIRVVIDSGLSRVPRFDPRSGLTRLETVRVTKDAADQRAGRAGRLLAGTCYRLWNEGIQASLQESRRPEILEADLAPLMLELSQWGIQDIKELKWITPPPFGAVQQARELLIQLHAIENGTITARGKEMLRLPTHPRIAHLLLEAPDALKSLAADVAALLEERDPMEKEKGADLSLRIEILRRWRSGERVFADRNVLDRIEKLAANWRRLLHMHQDNTMPGHFDVGRLLIAAYPERIAQQLTEFGERYKMSNGRVARLQGHDPLVREPWLCIALLDAGSGEGKIFMAAAVSVSDLFSEAEEQEVVYWDDERGMVAAVLEKTLQGLRLDSKPIHKIAEEKRVPVLCTMIREKGLSILGWGESQQYWQARVMSLRAWRKDEDWPDVSDAHLAETVDTWLSPFLINVSKQIELQRLNWDEILPTLLSWDLGSTLDSLAPSKIKVPSGSLIQVQYFKDGRLPVMEVRLQEMFGLLETPTINAGRTKVVLHLLSPGYKPVQVTQDLRSFWQTTYHEVRKELRMRYPKHHWPEDPWTAEAVRGVKRKH
ncbi:MAG TPA: ATP-dependent helicase HrpB [Ohtaekwangia sp.]